MAIIKRKLETPLTDDSPCPVNGKYHRVPMGRVPARFLDWFIGQPHLVSKYPTVALYVEKNKSTIAKELADPRRYGVGDPREDDDLDPERYTHWDD